MRVVLQEPGFRSGAALRCFLWAVLSLTACFLSCITLFQLTEHRLTGHLHRLKMLLLGKGVILFLCMFCLTVAVRSWSGSPHTLAEDCYFYGVIFLFGSNPWPVLWLVLSALHVQSGLSFKDSTNWDLSFLGLHNCGLRCARVYWQMHTRVVIAGMCS